jgi:hypothetical protein
VKLKHSAYLALVAAADRMGLPLAGALERLVADGQSRQAVVK